MPRWLDRLLPFFDVEGEGLSRELEHANWPSDAPGARVAASRLVLPSGLRVPELRLLPGQALVLDPADPVSAPLAAVLSGRGPLKTGTLKVAGLLLPERAASLRTRSAWASPRTLDEALADGPEILVLDLRDAWSGPENEAARRLLHDIAEEEGAEGAGSLPTLVVLGAREAAGAILPPRLERVGLADAATSAESARKTALKTDASPQFAARIHGAPAHEAPLTEGAGR
jgi:RND superfamily putative drug exporter